MCSDSILKRIRALFAKADDAACTPHEAEAFAAKANELLVKHKLTRADLDPERPAVDAIGADLLNIGDLLGTRGASIPIWGQMLTDSISRYNFCRMLRIQDQYVALFGTPTDREVVRYLCATLVRSAKVGADAFAADVPPKHRRRARNSFLLGFATTVARRLRHVRAATEAQHATSPYALVTLRNADKAVDDHIASIGGSTGQRERKVTINRSAHDAGCAAGERAHIGTAVGAGETMPAEHLLGA